MIVVTHFDDRITRYVNKGDTLNLEIDNETILSSEIKEEMTISYYAIFLFVDEDGTVRNPNLCGIFGDKYNLPPEIKYATKLDELNNKQKRKFIETCGLKVRLIWELVL